MQRIDGAGRRGCAWRNVGLPVYRMVISTLLVSKWRYRNEGDKLRPRPPRAPVPEVWLCRNYRRQGRAASIPARQSVRQAELSDPADSRTSRSFLQSIFREPLIAVVLSQEAQSQSRGTPSRVGGDVPSLMAATACLLRSAARQFSRHRDRLMNCAEVLRHE